MSIIVVGIWSCGALLISSGDKATFGVWLSSTLVRFAEGPDSFGEFPAAAGELAVDSRFRSIGSWGPFMLLLLFVTVGGATV